jgi:Cell wall-associated hydrolases (invasion-associated proteins)
MFKNQTKILLSCILLICFCISGLILPMQAIPANAASPVTSIMLAEHGLNAYNDKWVYNYGSAGQKNSSGKRQSDCSGLIYAFFTDNKISGAPRSASAQANASVQSGNINTIPRIHGLLLTISGYSHVGIYLGNNKGVDNRNYNKNMVYENAVGSTIGWVKWHMLDAGMQYPTKGFYAFNGKMYYYVDRQYAVNTTITYNNITYKIGSDGIVCDSAGKAIAVNNKLPNEGFSPAKPVNSSVPTPTGKASTITVDSVNLRSKPNTTSSVVTVLYKNTTVYVTDTVSGTKVSDEGKTSNQWYACTTASGQSGYVSSVYVALGGDANSTPAPSSLPNPTPQHRPDLINAPTFKYSGGALKMTSSTDGAAIYYTTNGSTPSEANGTLYAKPLTLKKGKTFKAVAVKDNYYSAVTTKTILSSGVSFTDISPGAWYFSYVDKAVAAGIFSGNGNGTFAPTKNITRAEFLTVLANMSGEKLSNYSSNSGFSDVSQNAWYAKVVTWGVKKGYILGNGNGKFAPEATLTRQQMCLILQRYAGLSGSSKISNKFNDHHKIDSYAVKAVYKCRDLGIVSGKGGNLFAPQDPATRSEIAALMLKYINSQS